MVAWVRSPRPSTPRSCPRPSRPWRFAVAHRHERVGARVAVTCAAFVSAYLLATRGYQKPVNRMVRSLAEEIPQLHVDRRVVPGLGSASRVAEVAVEVLGVLADMQGVLAQQVMVGNLVDVSLDQLCSKVALAKAQQPCIGVDLERLLEPKGIYVGDSPPRPISTVHCQHFNRARVLNTVTPDRDGSCSVACREAWEA